MEITKDEQLAFLCALDKRVAPALKEAKNEARAEIMDAYAENGTDRKAILVGGEKVGEVGISFLDYLNRYRIEQILECILQTPTLSFEQVALNMGFSDMRNFYRVFKRIMGTTPGKYRSGEHDPPPPS